MLFFRATTLMLFACVLMTLSHKIMANSHIAPADLLKTNAKTFSLSIDYRGPATGKKDPCLVLSVLPPPAVKLRPNIERMVCIISADEARKIIDAVVADGALGRQLPAEQTSRQTITGYVMMINAANANFEMALGADLATLHHLDALRQALNGDAATAMDKFLDFLKDSRKQWADEGRVFDRDGMALFIKPPLQAFPPGVPVTFAMKFQNITDHPVVLNHDPADIDWWNLSIRSTKDQPEFYVVRKGRQPQPAAGQSLTIKPGDAVSSTLSLAGCQYLAKPVKFPAPMIAIDSLPAAKYTVELSTNFDPTGNLDPHVAVEWTGTLVTAPITFEATSPAVGPTPSGGK